MPDSRSTSKVRALARIDQPGGSPGVPTAERQVEQQLGVSRNAARLLHRQLELLNERALVAESPEHADALSAQAARLASAIARLQAAQALGALALTRLRDGGVVQRIIVEHVVSSGRG